MRSRGRGDPRPRASSWPERQGPAPRARRQEEVQEEKEEEKEALGGANAAAAGNCVSCDRPI